NVMAAVERAAPLFEAKTGIKVNVVEQPDFNQLIPDVQTKATAGAKDQDVYLLLNVWMGDLVNMGVAEPMDSYISADANNPELSWDDVPAGMKAKMNWGGHTYIMMLDNDHMFLHYRKDVLSDPNWQQQYMAAKGRA